MKITKLKEVDATGEKWVLYELEMLYFQTELIIWC